MFLDRDGVINEPVWRATDGVHESPLSVADVELVPRVADAVLLAHDAGWVVVIASNQPAAAKGTVPLDQLRAVHDEVLRRLAAEGAVVDGSYICFHHPEGLVSELTERCSCRKPQPGLVFRAADDLDLDLGSSWLVGDTDADVGAARNAGLTGVGVVLNPRSAHRRGPLSETADLNGGDTWSVVAEIVDRAGGAEGRGTRGPRSRAYDRNGPVHYSNETVIQELRVKVFADGADIADIARLAATPGISGFTTNPTLMWKAGLTDYTEFAHRLLEVVPDRPISFEVFADDESEMRRQARVIAAWGPNVFIKIPVTNTQGESTAGLVRELSEDGVQLNVTALMLTSQVETVTQAVADGAPCFISVFAGRVADTGVDPLPLMRESLQIMTAAPRSELIWASPRESLNIIQADEIGCHVITVTADLLNKINLFGKDLQQFSLETVQMFHRDASSAGFTL